MATPVIDPATGERVDAAVQIDPATGERITTAQPQDDRNWAQKAYDTAHDYYLQPRAGLAGQAGHAAAGVLDIVQPLFHPEQTLHASFSHPIPGSNAALDEAAREPSMLSDPARLAGQVVGGTVLGAAGAKVAGATADTAANAGTAIREAALGDPNVATMRGLHVSPQSPKAIPTLNAAEGARPFLQGVQGLQDLQNRIPVAKQEIWQPYQDALAKIGDKQVKGPDGQPTTVQALEDRRQELSAQLRTLRKGGPEAVQLAQQKGLTQASLLREESQVRSILDPQLRQTGIDPVAIRKAFGQVSQVGSRVAGKTTVGEANQPYGFARVQNLSITQPVKSLPEALAAARDIAAGRYWAANPTDLNIREAFRAGGPKPVFTGPPQPAVGASYPTPASTAYQLPATSGAPTILPYYPEMTPGEKMAGLMQLLRNARAPLALPAEASPIILPPPR